MLKLSPFMLLGLVVPLFIGVAVLPAGDPSPEPQKNGKPAAKEDAKDDKEKSKEDKKKKKEEPKDRFFAITGGTVHTVTDGELTGVTILTKNGKITEIAPTIALPDDCEVLDVSGYHVYPGLVAVSSSGLLGSEPPDDTTNLYSLQMTIALAGGITTAVTGNTAARLTFGSTEDMIVKRNLFKSLSYSTSDPQARRKLRAAFDKVRQYIRDLEAFEEKKKTDPDAEEPDKEWLKGQYEGYLKLLRRETVAVFTAHSGHEIRDVCDLVGRYGFRAVIRGAAEGWTVAPVMARAGVSALIAPRRRAPRDERVNRPSGSSIENAAILHRHGVRIAVVPPTTAITLWGLAGRDLLQLNMDAAFAVRGGLDGDAALRTITIDAARILGIDHRVGSIEVGKDADFAITDGDILHYMTSTRWTVVNGKVAYDKQKDSLYNHIRPDGDLDAPPPDDYWPRRLGAEQ